MQEAQDGSAQQQQQDQAVNPMQDQDSVPNVVQADGQPAQMNEQIQEDGFVVLNNQNANIADPSVAADAKPEFGPSATNILAPMMQDIQRTASSTTGVPQNFDTHVVLMKGITWSRDSHGLFDYESRHLTKKTLKAAYEAMIMRSGNELSLVNYDSAQSFQEQINNSRRHPTDMPMLKIVNHGSNTFYLESAAYQHHPTDVEHMEQHGKSQESMYLVVRSLKINNEKIDYEIQQQDILKIGRVKFAVKEIGYADRTMEVDSPKEEKGHSANSVFSTSNEEDFEEFIQVPATYQDMSHEDPERKCRFCWASEASEENPLLGTCKCAGSVAQIHYNCLSAWLQTRQQQKLSANFSTYFWKAFECEICKTAYPLMMKTEQGHSYNLVKYDKPQGDYMVLESLSQEKNTSRIIHIIRPSANKTVFKLGRGHESDLRINDISVSRCHTKIKFERGKFLLEDNQSKFGTLVLVKQRTPLLPGFNKAVQVGRTVINFSVKHLQKPDAHAAQTAGAEDMRPDIPESTPGQEPVGAMGVVRTNTKVSAQSATSGQQTLQRRASEREMPSAEEQFAAQMGSNPPEPQPQPVQQVALAPPQQPLVQAQPPQISAQDHEFAMYPEDLQLQMALQASMQTSSAGQALGNQGDQDSVNPGGNDADE